MSGPSPNGTPSGGDGETPAASPEPPRRPQLVVPEVSRAKLARELGDWDELASAYRRRGWVMLDRDLDQLRVDVAFHAAVDFPAPGGLLTVVAACIRLNFLNYDLEPPSLTFIDPMTGELRPPLWSGAQPGVSGALVPAVLEGHPRTGAPFLCAPGVWEYHIHHAHDNDRWLADLRARKAGSLGAICERVWDSFANDLALGTGIQVTLQFGRRSPGGNELQTGLAGVSA